MLHVLPLSFPLDFYIWVNCEMFSSLFFFFFCPFASHHVSKEFLVSDLGNLHKQIHL